MKTTKPAKSAKPTETKIKIKVKSATPESAKAAIKKLVK